MTRSPRASRLGARRRLARLLALPVLVAAACGGRELSLGGDPLALSVVPTGSGGSSAGAGTGGDAGAVSGAGGIGGTITIPATGGASAGVGGAGGSATFVGSGGSAADAANGGAGDDPYPPVSYRNGAGYRNACPAYDDVSGFTCWHFESGAGSTCGLDGSPPCNACSCAIPCEEAKDCPPGAEGEPATCVGSDTNVKSCFLDCNDRLCPSGMECSLYPGTEDRVCMWVDPSAGMVTPVK